jgi:hypothetical protein
MHIGIRLHSLVVRGQVEYWLRPVTVAVQIIKSIGNNLLALTCARHFAGYDLLITVI